MLSGRNEQVDAGGTSGMDVADDEDEEPISRGRTRGAPPINGMRLKERRKAPDDLGSSEQSDDASDVTSSGHEWDGGDDDGDDQVEESEDEEDLEMSDEGASEEDELAGPSPSLVVRLRLAKGQSKSPQPGPLPNTESEQFTPNTNHDMSKTVDTEMADAPAAIQHPTTSTNGISSTSQRAEQLLSLPIAQPGHSATSPLRPVNTQNITANPTSPAPRAPPIFNPHAYTYNGEPPAPSSGAPPPSGFSAPKQVPPVITLPNGTAPPPTM